MLSQLKAITMGFIIYESHSYKHAVLIKSYTDLTLYNSRDPGVNKTSMAVTYPTTRGDCTSYS